MCNKMYENVKSLDYTKKFLQSDSDPATMEVVTRIIASFPRILQGWRLILRRDHQPPQQVFHHGRLLSTQLIGAVIVQMSLAHLGMAENLDVALFLVLQAFLVSGLRQKQAGPFAFPAHRRIVGQHIEDNHVPGVLGKPLQIHVLMAVVVLRPGLEPHFLHQLAHGLTLRHGAHLLSRVPGLSQSGYRPGW